MRLKSLELHGYKSFAAKTIFQFDEGITAVVGPNGSGKSNISDALRWALGEQSYGALRGKKTEDMIFSGSDGRARLGMAQVSLVLDNSEGWLPVDFSEVTLIRRAYRDGQNEYVLNGNRVRLRDINELLAASGLSRRTYTVIGQGLVDAALSLRAEERRALFEEAAGISLHRAKRAEALNKLDATHSNLLRVNDIVSEIEPRLAYLERQAERAAQNQVFSTQLKALLRIWYGYRWRRGQERLHKTRLVHERSQRDLDAQRALLEQAAAQINELRRRQTQLRGQLGELHREGSRLHSEAESLQRTLAVGEERARWLSAQREELLSEIEPLQVVRQAAEERIAEAQSTIAQSEAELEAARARTEHVRARLDAHHAERRKLLDQQSEAEREARELADRVAGHRARLAQLAERRIQLQREAELSQQSIATNREQQAMHQEELSQKEAALRAVVGELEILEGQRRERLAAAQKLGARAGELEAEIASLQRHLEALRARHDLLSRMQEDLAGFYEGVRNVLKAGRGAATLRGVVGSVAQLLRVPRDLETAMEAALGGHVQDVVVESWADAEAAIAYLKTNHAGRATFLPLDTLKPSEPIHPPDTPGVLGVASELVKYAERVAPVARLLLGRTLVVEDLPAARHALAAMRGGFQIVTRSGEMVRSSGSVSGGSVSREKAGGGFLAREREWRELPATITKQEARRQDFQAQLEENQHAQAGQQAALEELNRRQADLEVARASTQRKQEALVREIERTEEAIQWQQSLLDARQKEVAELDQGEGRLRTEIESFETARAQTQARSELLAAEAAALAAEALLVDLSQAQTELAVIQGRRDSQGAVLDGHQASLSDLTRLIEAKERRCRELFEERDLLLGRLEAQRDQDSQFQDQIAAMEGRIQPVEQELGSLEEQQATLEGEEGHMREMLHRLETEHGRAALEFGRRQDELEMLRRQIEEDLGLVEVELSEDQVGQPYLPLRPLVSQLPNVTELPEDVEIEVRRLKVQLGRLGSVNPNAPKEFEELRARHEFLIRQMADLEQAATDLRQVIAELDRLMEREFSDTFEAVAIEFRGYFKQLFGGGEARLVLTEPDNLTETGIDISARPPSKRLQSLSMLSGGERALTAVALIFSLLKVSPTPFCVLDEVDAMLDEANVGRFRQELEKLAKTTQVIIITHNRRTIEAANIIYGISMGDDAASRVISLKLDQVAPENPSAHG